MNNLTGLLAGSAGRRGPTRQAGVSMVEFAIVSPIALLIVMGLVQLGLSFTAKQLLNEATFVAARAGAVQNAQRSAMQDAFNVAMVPFYQNAFTTDAATRISQALKDAKQDLTSENLTITVLNPSADVFSDFGLQDAEGNTYIPNDNLEYRDSTPGNDSGLSIQEANTLKIRVTYAYPIKVPLMQYVFSSVMCATDTGIDVWGRGGGTPSSDCANYYSRGRMPIVAYATVQMQTRAQQ
jgi:Flp pilus assembly protein TadG